MLVSHFAISQLTTPNFSHSARFTYVASDIQIEEHNLHFLQILIEN
jgi:hypothetical protein